MSVPPAAPPPPDWQLRVLAPDGDTAGAGALVSPRHVLTCAHVVCAALGIPWEEAATPRPGRPVAVDAPRGGGSWKATASVLDDGWFADRSPWDAAVLLLDRPAPAAPPEVRRCGAVDRPGRPVSMVGFSHDEAPAGVWSQGRLVGGGGRHYEHVQFDVRSSTAVRVVHGFSGSGVRENRSGALIGIVCDADHDDRGLGVSGWMIPVEAVPAVWGGDVASPSRPPRDSPRVLHDLAVALAEVPTIADPDARRGFYDLLDSRVRHNLRTDLAPRLFASRLVKVARDHDGLLAEVIDVLGMVEEGSAPMRRVWEAAEALGDR